MLHETIPFKNTNAARLVLLISILVALFWYVGQTLNIYRYALVGVVFEILWLPMIGALFVLPVISVIRLRKERFNVRSLYLYSILVIGLAVLFMVIT
jgi:heme O synthase-like polyprenyltransferase